VSSRAGRTGGHGSNEILAVDLPLDLAAVEVAREAVVGLLEPMRVDELVLNRIEVVLEELVSNVVRHGIDVHSLKIEVAVADRVLQIVVIDDGAAFDPLVIPERDRYSDLELAIPGGQGIPLVRRFTRDAAYRRGANENRISCLMDLA